MSRLPGDPVKLRAIYRTELGHRYTAASPAAQSSPFAADANARDLAFDAKGEIVSASATDGIRRSGVPFVSWLALKTAVTEMVWPWPMAGQSM
jgi:hypothetical protein